MLSNTQALPISLGYYQLANIFGYDNIAIAAEHYLSQTTGDKKYSVGPLHLL